MNVKCCVFVLLLLSVARAQNVADILEDLGLEDILGTLTDCTSPDFISASTECVSADSSGGCSAACQTFVDKYGDECEDTVRTLAAACFDDSDSDEDSASDEDSDVGEVDDIETEVNDDDTAVDDADVEDEDYGDDNSIPADINIPGLPRECVEYFSKNEQLSQECEAAKETATSCPDSCKTWFGNYPKSCLEASQKFAEQFSGLFGNIDLDLEDVDYEEDVCADFFKAGGFGQGESSSSPPPEEEPTEEAEEEEEAETETSATPTATASPAPTSTTPTTATPAPTTTNGASPRSLMSVVVAGMAMGLVMM